MDINHLTLEELKIVKDAITQRINELSGETPQQESLEKSKLALRKYILENKEEVIKDLQEIRDKSSKNKQETLEEAAAKEFPLVNDESCKTGFVEKINLKFIRARQTFIKGAKWQSERMYSEEDLKLWLMYRDIYLYNHYTTYLELGLPLQSVDDFIKESYEHLMNMKKN
jgi:hypothetical protein